MDTEFDLHSETYPHIYLWNCAEKLKEVAQHTPTPGGHIELASLLTAYLAFEAFVNFIGVTLFPELWEKEKDKFKDQIEEKVLHISESLQDFTFSKGKRPYQTIKKIQKLRTLMVHGKVVQTTNRIDESELHPSDGLLPKWNFEWFTHIEPKALERGFSDIQTFCQSMQCEARKVSDHSQLQYDAFRGPFGHTTTQR